jgi:hypothetical protein
MQRPHRVKSDRFVMSYLRALSAAALTFSLTHSAELFLIGLVAHHSASIDSTVFITLSAFTILEWIVFVTIGGPISYVPSRAIYRLFRKRAWDSYLNSILCCLFVAAAALPLCAAVPFFIFPSPDEPPSYLYLCIEFFLPMTISGALGGHVFWVGVGDKASDRSIADQFV